MVTQEHLDYHRSVDEYINAKSSVTKFQTPDDFAIINADFENSMLIGRQGDGKKLYFSRKKAVNQGCFIKEGQITCVGENDIFPYNIEIANTQLKGAHNLENINAAALAAKCAGADAKVISDVIAGFKGLEHRLEFVAEKNGIKFYNDSFSTTPETAIAAIKSFTEPLVIILGGSSKNSDFKELGKIIVSCKNIKAIVLVGDEAAAIKKAISSFAGKLLEGAKSMPEIFSQISSVAQKGDVVLLSPACASFGMFKNYKDRGEQFKRQVLGFKV
jgi:UDP-N-acetylmuramoylalanine--D-glutamate ligase